MTPHIEAQLAAKGAAKVIVVLRTPGAATTAAAVAVRSRPSGASMRSMAAALEQHFVLPETSQEVALAAANVHAVVQKSRDRRRRAQAPGRAQAALERAAALAVAPPRLRVYENLGIVLGTVTRSGLDSLSRDPRVAEVTGAPAISLIRPTATGRARVRSGTTWGLRRLGIPDLWTQGLRGKGVIVGHLDTGVDGQHAALKGAIAAFAEFDLMGNIVSGAAPHDSDEHGTHTAGTIVGRSVRRSSFGVAPEAQLASALVIEGGDVIARILGGLNWIVGQGARVLSMSLGLRGFHDDFLPLTRILRARGILPVFAVGNEGPGTSRSPGNYAEALSVGASAQDDTVANFSSSERFARPDDPLVPDIVGPGVDVLSCVPGGGFAQMSGTSMATPHIAGLAALLFEAKKTATVDEVEHAIFGSCTLPPTMSHDRANRGIPNGVEAVAALTGTTLTASVGGSRARRRRRVARK